jgi:hypothetical protein
MHKNMLVVNPEAKRSLARPRHRYSVRMIVLKCILEKKGSKRYLLDPYG